MWGIFKKPIIEKSKDKIELIKRRILFRHITYSLYDKEKWSICA